MGCRRRRCTTGCRRCADPVPALVDPGPHPVRQGPRPRVRTSVAAAARRAAWSALLWSCLTRPGSTFRPARYRGVSEEGAHRQGSRCTTGWLGAVRPTQKPPLPPAARAMPSGKPGRRSSSTALAPLWPRARTVRGGSGSGHPSAAQGQFNADADKQAPAQRGGRRAGLAVSCARTLLFVADLSTCMRSAVICMWSAVMKLCDPSARRPCVPALARRPVQLQHE
jgi:hypothetical protein